MKLTGIENNDLTQIRLWRVKVRGLYDQGATRQKILFLNHFGSGIQTFNEIVLSKSVGEMKVQFLWLQRLYEPQEIKDIRKEIGI
jgi:hypothetical protein